MSAYYCGICRRRLSMDQRHVEVASCDSFSLGRRARYGEWADGAIDCPDGAGYGDRLRRSLTRYWRWFNNV